MNLWFDRSRVIDEQNSNSNVTRAFYCYDLPHSFLRLLLNGTYDYIRHKLLYVFLDHFPEGGRQDGWIADDYLRTFLTRNGMSRVVGIRSDDVFVINDADEIPAHEGLLFLKLFDGWTEPFAIHMRKVAAVGRDDEPVDV